MAIEKIWKCDFDGSPIAKADMRRVGVRTTEDRPDNADWLEVGPCCYGRPIGDLIAKAAEQRRITEHGE
jgi:hypothetical protein